MNKDDIWNLVEKFGTFNTADHRGSGCWLLSPDHMELLVDAISKGAAQSAASAPVADEAESGTLVYARNLAVSLHANHYADVKGWRPLPDVLGLLTQIDNMIAGLVRAPASEAQPVEADYLVGIADLILHLHQWQAAPAGEPSTVAWAKFQSTIDELATPAGADAAALLQGVESLLREAYEHWDADREFKVGKILLALIGHNKGYDKRSDAFRAALQATPLVEAPAGADAARLHSTIMNLSAPASTLAGMAGPPKGFYLLGFRDARHAAAELVTALQATPASGEAS